MKKILLTTAAAAVLATSSSNAYAAEGDFYGRANVGFTKFKKVTPTINTTRHNHKSQNTGFFGIAAGYYLMNNVRTELAIDHFFSPEHKYSHEKFKTESRFKGQVDTLLINTYVDLFDISGAQIFAGVGVGVARTKVKYSAEQNGAAIFLFKSKTSNALSYALHLGTSTEFAPGMHSELVYSYRDMGKTGKLKDKNGKDTNRGMPYSAHNVAAGVRFDL